jgi:hypothetical protein
VDLLRQVAFGTVAICMVLWVGLNNGYPTVYPDTGGYLYTGAFHVALPPFRSPVYSVFMEWMSLGISAWFIVIAQAVVAVFALYEALRLAIPGESKFRDYCMLGIAFALAALTSLPWQASLLMPDIFAGTVFLSAFSVAFNGRLRLAERVVLAAILTISVGAHQSLLPIAALFVAALVVPRIVGYRLPGAPPLKTMLAWLLIPIAVSCLWTANLNRNMGLGFRLSVSGNEFLLGRLFDNGLANNYLHSNCPRKGYIACRHLNDLPTTTEQFLFWNPLLHDMDVNREEIDEIVYGTLAAHPLRFAADSILQTARQFATFRTGQEVRDFALNAPNWNPAVIQLVLPHDSHAFSNSRLIRGRLLGLIRVLSPVHSAVFWLSAAGCLMFALTKRFDQPNAFFYSAIAFLAINAAVCGSLAGVYDRYQSRVAWILPLCFACYVCRVFEKRQRVDS